MSNTLDVTGKRFGKLLLLERLVFEDGTYYRCKCDCGKELNIRYRNIYNGKGSCGCWRLGGWRTKTDAEKKVSVMWANYRDKAKRRNLDWQLTKEEFSKLVQSTCHYCAAFPTSGFVGVDRKNSSLGYVIDNCVSACSQCNFAKSDTPYEEFKEWVRKVYANMV